MLMISNDSLTSDASEIVMKMHKDFEDNDEQIKEMLLRLKDGR